MYVKEKIKRIKSERKKEPRKSCKKTGDPSRSEASMSNKIFEHFYTVLSQNFYTVLSERLHRPQNPHNIRSEGYPRVSSLDLFKTEGRVK